MAGLAFQRMPTALSRSLQNNSFKYSDATPKRSRFGGLDGSSGPKPFERRTF
jgi:hypothetical protein